MIVSSMLLLLALAASPELADGRVALSALQYAKAVTLLSKAAADPQTTSAEQIEANELLARAHLALGHTRQAEEAFGALLRLSPMTPPPSGAPSLRTAFRNAKVSLFPAQYVRLTRRTTNAEVLELEVLNPWALPLEVELWQALGSSDFERRVRPLDGDHFVAALPPGARSFVRVVGADGVLLASLGSSTEPLAGPAAPPVADAPLRVESPRVLPQPEAPVVLAPAPAWSARRVTSVVVGVLGVVAMVIGGVVMAAGFGEQGRFQGWPLNGLSHAESVQAQQNAPPLLIGGGVSLGLGLAAAVTGGVLFFSSQPADGANANSVR